MKLKRLFVPKTGDVTSEWQKSHNEKFHNLYPSPNTVQVGRKDGWNMALPLVNEELRLFYLENIKGIVKCGDRKTEREPG
jgi:hypothetical protein